MAIPYKRLRQIVLACSICVSAVCFTSCNNFEDHTNEPFIDEWRMKAEKLRAESVEVPPRNLDRSESIEPQHEQKRKLTNSKALPTQKISLTMRDVEVSAVIRALAKLAGYNVMIASGVVGTVSVDLNKVPWDQAFKGVLRANSLFYVWEYDILRVLSMTDMEKGIQFEEMQTKLNEVRKASRLVEPLQVRAVKIHHLDVNKVAQTLSSLLSRDRSSGGQAGEVRGSIVVDEDINTIIIRAISDDINNMLTLIEEIDQPSYLVFVEAQIVLATKEIARELGTEWNVQYANSFKDVVETGGMGVGGVNIYDNIPSDIKTNKAGNGVFAYNLSKGDWDLNLTLQALETDEKINVISSPSITTLDNHTAYVESGSEIPYQTSSDAGGTETSFKKAVLRLEITPHVIDDDILKINIYASKDEPDTDLANIDGEPAILTRKSETTLLLRDGQTTVIAGLTETTDNDTEFGIPILKDIPYLGYFFKTSTKTKDFDDLLIFITPHILNKDARRIMQEARKEKTVTEEATQLSGNQKSKVTEPVAGSQSIPKVGRINNLKSERPDAHTMVHELFTD